MITGSFNHLAAYIAARICVELPTHGPNKVLSGTGFFYHAPIKKGETNTHSMLLLISNKHVLNAGVGKMTLTLNRRKKDGTPEYGGLRTFAFDKKEFATLYRGHPDDGVDLACTIVTGILSSDAFFRYLDEPFLTPINYERVALGSEVLFVGYPNDYYDTTNNLPLVRKGTLASLPSIDFRGTGNVVIDAQVFGGSSGSPVFVDWNNKYRLLGVISATREGLTPSGFPAVLGLGLVIKQRHVQELINHVVKEVGMALELTTGVLQGSP